MHTSCRPVIYLNMIPGETLPSPTTNYDAMEGPGAYAEERIA